MTNLKHEPEHHLSSDCERVGMPVVMCTKLTKAGRGMNVEGDLQLIPHIMR